MKPESRWSYGVPSTKVPLGQQRSDLANRSNGLGSSGEKNVVQRCIFSRLAGLWSLSGGLCLAVLTSVLPGVGFAQNSPLTPPIEPSAGMVRGDWSDDVSIDVPPGPRGFQPTIAISHTRAAQDGPLGFGYVLSASQMIQRRSETGGLAGHTEQSTFYLNGERLIFYLQGEPLIPDRVQPVQPVPPATKTLYKRETDDGSRVTYAAATNTWTVDLDGWSWVFGTLEDAGANATVIANRLKVPQFVNDLLVPRPLPGGCLPGDPSAPPGAKACNTVQWHLAKVIDPFGNFMTYDYRSDPVPASLRSVYGQSSTKQALLDEIKYYETGGALIGRVAFSYQDRPDPQVSYSGGERTLLTKRLTGITTYNGSRTYSKYQINYKDTDGTDCDGRPIDVDDYFSDARDLTGDMPLQSLIRRITRVDVENALFSRTLRCIETSHKALRDGNWDPPETVSDLAPIGDERAVVLPTNINGDGRTDLLIIREDGAHQVLVSEGAVGTPFSDDDSTIGVQSWKTLLNTTLTSSFLGGDRGWLILDLDRNGYADLLHESTFGDPGRSVQLRDYRPKYDHFFSSLPDLLACDLRFSTSGDVDGDGFPDLIQRAHPETDDCPARLESRWLRNLGRAPWFDRGPGNDNWQDLLLPLEDPEAAGLDVVPPEMKRDWTPQFFVGDQARFADINSDGVVDVAYAFHTRWEKHRGSDPCPSPEPRIDEEPCQWQPVANTIHSRIYWGDGYGGFVDSGLSAGWPILNHLEALNASGHLVPETYFVSHFGVLDATRSGAVELMTANGIGSQLAVHHYRGARMGFSGIAVGEPGATDPANLMRQFYLDVGDYPQITSDCNEVAAMPILADFDGDGFPDLLEFRYDPDGIDEPACFGQDSCVTIRFSNRETAQGRVIASDSAWGGRTKLEWKYTGDPATLWSNPELHVNVEALERVDGSEGEVVLGYHHGAVGDGGFRGFGLVTRRNARGGIDSFAHALTPPLADRLLYAARYRSDGTPEKVTVNAYGKLAGDDAYAYDVRAPYFNPRVRQCHFEVERNRSGSGPDISSLIRQCYGWGARTAPSDVELWGLAGLDRQPALSPAKTLSEIAWGEVESDTASVTLTGSGGSDGWNYWQALLPLGAPPVTWRWPAPTPIPTIPDPEVVAGITEPTAEGTGRSVYITDWVIDEGQQRAVQVINHRSTKTPDDDLVETLEWESFGSSGNYRLIGARTAGGSGDVLSIRRFSDFSGFQEPGKVVDCGSGAGACLTTRSTYRPNGELESRSVVETGDTERWESSSWCGSETYVNPLGEERIREFDDRCRLVSETWRGVVRTSVYDGFNRPVRLVVDPNGDAPPSSSELLYDDSIAFREDKAYVEPRSVILRDGVLDMLHFDGFGRPTRRVRCAAGRATKSGGDLRVQCAGNAERRVLEWYIYGTDGEIYAAADPFDPVNEAPVFTLTPYRDGYGRPFVTLIPDNSPASEPSWFRELSWRAPGRDVSRDALGRVTVTSHDTLQTARTVDGQQIYRLDYDAFGRVVQREEPNTPTTRYGYDKHSRLAAVTYAETERVVDEDGSVRADAVWQRNYTHDLASRSLRTKEPNGLQIVEQHDLLGRPVMRRSIGSDGAEIGRVTWRYEADAEGRVVETFTDDLGAEQITVFDGLGRIVREETPDGITRDYSYDPPRRTIEVATEDGGLNSQTTYRYDAFSRLARYVGPDGSALSAVRDGAGRIIAATDEAGVTHTTNYRFSGAPYEVRRVGAGGDWLVARNTFDRAFRLSEARAEDVASRFEYDDLDRPIRRRIGTGADHELVEITYQGRSLRPATIALSAPGFPTSTTTLTYDKWRRQTGWTNPEPGSSQVLYDIMHRPRQVRDEEGVLTTFAYDQLGRPVEYHDPRNGRIRTGYSSLRGYTYGFDRTRSVEHVRLVETRFPSGATRAEWQDAAGRLLALRDTDGLTEEYVYSGSRLTDVYRLPAGATGPAVTRLHYEYDDWGRLVAAYGPAAPASFPEPFNPAAFAGYKVLLELGSDGRLAAVSAAGERTEFTYDAVSGLLASESFGGVTRKLLRAQAGNGPAVPSTRVIGERELGRGHGQRVTTYEYNERGHLIRREVIAGGKQEVSRWENFDPFGNPIHTLRQSGPAAGTLNDEVAYRWTYDRNGRPTSRVLQLAGQTIGASGWEWYRNDTLKTETAPFGRLVTYEYGPRFDMLLDRVVTPDDGAVQAAIRSRDPSGRPTSIALPDGSMSMRWTGSGNLQEQDLADPTGAALEGHRFIYDDQARLSAHEIRTPTSHTTHGYGYDVQGFLISETFERDGVEQTLRYALNEAGGRLSTALDEAKITSIAYNPAFPLTKVASVNGRPITYDDWNAVLVDQHGVRYERSASGAVSSLSSDEGTIEILRDADGVPVASRVAGRAPRITSWRLDPGAPPQAMLMPGGASLTYVAGEGRILRRLFDSPSGTTEGDTPLFNLAGSIHAPGADLTSGADAFGASVTYDGQGDPFVFSGMEAMPGVPGLHAARHRFYDGQTGRFLEPDPAGLLGGLHRTFYAAADPVQFADALGLWACPAQPGSVPDIPFFDVTDPFQVPPPTLGVGNLHYEITQIQLAAGLEAVPLITLDLGAADILRPNQPPPCVAFQCLPPGGEGGGLPDDDVSTFPTGPIILWGKGGGPAAVSEGGESGEQRRGFFRRLFGKKEKTFEYRDRPDFVGPDGYAPWSGCDETISNAGCRHPVAGPGEGTRGHGKRLKINFPPIGAGPERSASPVPLDPSEHFTSPVPEAASKPTVDYQAEHEARIENARRLRQQGVSATPEQATADNPRIVEVVPPEPEIAALDPGKGPSSRPAPHTAPVPQQSSLEGILETDPFSPNLRPNAIQLRDLRGYPWHLNIQFGEHHPSRGDWHRPPIIESIGVSGVAEISAGPVSLGGKIDSEGNTTVTGAGGPSLTVGKVSGAGKCDTSASCTGSVALPLGGAGEFAVNPVTGTFTLFVGPSVTMDGVGAKAGMEAEAKVSISTLVDHMTDMLRNATGDVPPTPPDPKDPATW